MNIIRKVLGFNWDYSPCWWGLFDNGVWDGFPLNDPRINPS
jgi:hypothetical protein